MEELGVGRPSTYASVIATIMDRGYVWKKGSALVPSFTAFAVVSLLEQYFGDLVDYGFTAAMEDDLDQIATGREEALPWLSRFYFGVDTPPNGDSAAAPGTDGSNGSGGEIPGETGRLGLKTAVSRHLGEIDAREINSIPIGTDDEGRSIVARVGRYGPYLQRGDDRASIPDDIAPDELTVARSTELLDAPSGDRVVGTDPASGQSVHLLNGRFGPYVQLGELVDGEVKPKRASLFAAMSPENLSLDEALQLLSLPRTVGTDPDTAEEVVAANGRFGPYLKRGSDTRSLATEDQLFNVTLDEARAIFAQPKLRRGRGTPAPPLKELGADPETGLAVVVREGRFGPYVTDGTTNASLRRGDDAETVTIERASELLAERRAAGPSTRRRAGGAKKATAKKSTARKATAKKSTAKKPAAKKTAATRAPARKGASTNGSATPDGGGPPDPLE